LERLDDGFAEISATDRGLPANARIPGRAGLPGDLDAIGQFCGFVDDVPGGGYKLGVLIRDDVSFLLHEVTAIDATHRINEQIRISPVRVVTQNGVLMGAMPTSEALELARSSGLDLVEVAADERPPVCRIMDYGKFKYEQKRKQAKSAKTHQVQIKEIRLRPKTGEHDVEFKVKQARGFLTERDKVKVTIMFKGREMAHVDRGRTMILGVISSLEDIAKLEKPPAMEGRNMTAVLTPK
jgi:translation initiation factor IF-3